MRIVRRIGVWLAVGLICFVGLELTSLTAVWFLSRDASNPHLRHAIAAFHPLFSDFTGKTQRFQRQPIYKLAGDRNPFTFDPRTGYRFKPGGYFTENLPIGPQGFVCNGACETLALEKPASEMRIFVFGGSTVAGDGAPSNKTIPAFLERMLAERGVFASRRVRVVNLGVGGFASFQEAIYFINEMKFYAPDIVIFFNGYNDYRQWRYVNFDARPDHVGPLIRPNRHSYDYGLISGIDRVRTPAGAVVHTLNLLSERYPVLYYATVLAKHVRLAGSARRETVSAPDRATPEHAPADVTASLERRDRNSVATYIDNLMNAAAVASASGIPSLFYLQPALAFFEDGRPRKRGLAPAEVRELERIQVYDHLRMSFYTLAQRKFHALGARPTGTARFCDLTGVFRDQHAQMFVDEVHLMPAANAIIADAIFNDIADLAAGRAQGCGVR